MNHEILIQKINKIITLLESSNGAIWMSHANTICTILLAIVAFSSIIISIKNFRRSQRNEKIEEIYTIIEEFAHAYGDIHSVYLFLENYHGESDQFVKKNWHKEYQQDRKKLLNKIQIKNYFEKVMKLEILAKSYLCKTPQIKVLSFNRMYRDLLDCTINMNWMIKKMFWNEGFPSISSFNQYVDDLGNLLIKEIGISKENKQFRVKLKNYNETTFKQDLGIETKKV